MNEERSSSQSAQQAAPGPEVAAAETAIFGALGRDLDARGASKAKPYLPSMVKLKHEATAPVGKFRVVSFQVFGKFSTYSASYNARSGEQCSMMLGAFIKDGGEQMSRDEAVGIAAKTVTPPVGATLETATYDYAAGDPFFVVRWGHMHDGIKVERDFIQCLLNGKTKRVFAWHRKWHTVNAQATER